VLLGILMFIVVAAAAVLPPITAMVSIQRRNLVSFSLEDARAEPANSLSQAGVWSVRVQGDDQELQHWGFLLHMHTSGSAALSTFIVRCSRRAAIGIAGGATLATTGARPTAPAAVVLVCCIIEALHIFLRRPNSSLGMNATTALSIGAQSVAACLMLAAADASSTAAADAAMWLLFVASIILSLATAIALPFFKPLCPENWLSPHPDPSSSSSADASARAPSQHVGFTGPSATGTAAAVVATGSTASAASSSIGSIEKLSGMSLTVSVLQFKQLLVELPQNHLRSLLGSAGARSSASSSHVWCLSCFLSASCLTFGLFSASCFAKLQCGFYCACACPQRRRQAGARVRLPSLFILHKLLHHLSRPHLLSTHVLILTFSSPGAIDTA
jgi:hypothetical protein